MSGRFGKAPLVYVTASIRTTSRPDFKKDEWVDLQQALIRAGLKTQRDSTNHELNIAEIAESVSKEPSSNLQVGKRIRHAFFSKDEHECLLLGPDFVEYRVSQYTKYEGFQERFQEILKSITDSVAILGEIDTKELTLTYCDVIVPAFGSPLKDYFEKHQSILPLNFLERYKDDVWQAGQVQATRIISPTKKMVISLEQVPVDQNRRVGKWLPNNMLEPDPKLAMPLKILPEWQVQLDEKYFALLSIQASMLVELPLRDLRFETTLNELHDATKSTFNDIIHQDNCNRDWAYTSD